MRQVGRAGFQLETKPDPKTRNGDFLDFVLEKGLLEIHYLLLKIKTVEAAYSVCCYYVVTYWLSHVRLCDLMDCSPPGSCLWDFSGKNTGMGCHALLQGTQPVSPVSPALQADSLPT